MNLKILALSAAIACLALFHSAFIERADAAPGVQVCDANEAPLCAPFSYNHITTDATTLVKSGPGWLHEICINKPVVSSVITIDDAVTATTPTIGVITLPATLVTEGPNCAVYDVSFANGLTIVTATGASDLTVSYK